jgi:outer membrane immunogenic protein
MISKLLVLASVVFAINSYAQSSEEMLSEESKSGLMQDFDSLGGNRILLDRAKVLTPDQKVSIVQNRIVDRNLRFELAPEFGGNLGGDAYLRTQSAGMNAHFHITPKWSIGVKMLRHSNQFTDEAQTLIKDGEDKTGAAIVPDVDYPKDQSLMTVNWYPFYGKLNFFDRGVVHFDFYGLLGGGRVNLKSGNAQTTTAGGGIGFWLSQHLTARLEVRYQTYNVQRITKESQLQLTTAGVQLGYLF